MLAQAALREATVSKRLALVLAGVAPVAMADPAPRPPARIPTTGCVKPDDPAIARACERATRSNDAAFAKELAATRSANVRYGSEGPP